jgi:RNA polymerase-interacting CarD/CdnL/TRCF family regulator
MDRVMEATQETVVMDGGRRRHERLRASLQTGQALAAAKVICRLRALRQQRGSLTFTDRRILRRATTLLASELALVKNIPFDRAEHRVENLAAS